MKKSVIILVDALPYQLFKNSKNYLKILPNYDHLIEMKTIFGYSCGIIPAIWSGRSPQNSGMWVDPYFSYSNHKIHWFYSLLKNLPNSIAKIISLLFFSINIRTIKRSKYPPFFDYRIIPFFKFYQKYPDYNYDQIKKYPLGENIFTIFNSLNIPYKYSYKKFGLKQAKEASKSLSHNDVLILYDSSLDHLGHTCTIYSSKYIDRLKDILYGVKYLDDEGYNVFVFSDHGMTLIKSFVNVYKLLKKAFGSTLRQGRDYIIWTDSTMVRIWFLTKVAFKKKELIEKKLNTLKIGEIISKVEKRKYGIDFNSRKFGDIIFLANPGIEIRPNFFNGFPFQISKALHGYNPKDNWSSGIFYSNIYKYRNPIQIVDILPSILDGMNLLAHTDHFSFDGISKLKRSLL